MDCGLLPVTPQGRAQDEGHMGAPRRTALADPRLLAETLAAAQGSGGLPLEPRASCLVRLGALLASDPQGPSLQRCVDEALSLEMTPDDTVGLSSRCSRRSA